MPALTLLLAILAADPSLPGPLVYEAEDYTTPRSAWQSDQSSDRHWNLWSTDSDADRKWSGGVVLQSPVAKADRASAEEGAPVLHTRITGIPKGRYEVQIKLGRTLAISRDGNQWQRVTDGASAVGVVEVRDGTFDLWVDDRYAHEPPGFAYYDCLTFIPVPERPDRPKVAGFANSRICERLDRGLVARPAGEGRMHLGWRLLESDPKSIGFHIDRQGDGPLERLTPEPITNTTDFTDATARPGSRYRYTLRAVVDGKEVDLATVDATAGAQANPAIVFQLDPGTTVQKIAVGDLDGDQRYDYVIKTPQDNIDPAASYWKPSPDTYHLQAYSADGRKMWDKDLGWAIERGIWYSPMIVFDLDGDGRAEITLKSGTGDPRGPDGRVETGPEYFSVLDGRTGNELARTDWPSRQIPGEKYNYNLSSRNQICVAYLDGKTPCVVVNRGTYSTIRLVAYQFTGGQLQQLWAWDSREEADRGRYRAQGAHIMHAADIDGDGRDEIIYGSAVVDDNGNGLWTTELGHPDFCFVGEIDPLRPGLEIFYGIEPPRPDSTLCLADAQSGKILWKLDEPTTHVGTDGMCSDIDPRFPGCECYAADVDQQRKFRKGWLYSAQGQLISDQRDGTMSLPVYWDADLQRELIRRNEIVDYRGQEHATAIEGHVVAIADVLGDWREEIFTSVPGELRIYTTPIPAANRHTALMQDPIYRIDVAVAFMGYYAPPMLSRTLEAQP